jgi:hypothetical protein
MILSEYLLAGFSKPHTIWLASEIDDSQERFDELMTLFLSDDQLVAQRAAWVASHCTDVHPWLVMKHLKPMIENLHNPVHDAIKRNSLRMMRHVEIPEELMGAVADICFKFLNSAKEAIAVKVFAMDVLLNIVGKFPEMKEELKISIKDQLPFGSAGFQNRGTKILKLLDKMS